MSVGLLQNLELCPAVGRSATERCPAIAVDNGFGGVYGQQKADWMVDVVQQYFHDNADLQPSEVEDYLSDLMDQEFDTVVEDGSLPQVSVRLLQLFSQWQQGALQQLKHTINTLTQNQNHRAKVTAPPTQEESSDDEAQVTTPTGKLGLCQVSQPRLPQDEEEEDGWTLVRKKK
uniref:Pre-rRNA-processing protein TSR2 homolog n=1 Tax=Acanthochromis polyacanthus TaxID=80966 RepID=A0A3Q1G1L4_9TELE